MNRVLCSTGTVIGNANGRDYHLLADFHPHIECDGYEFLMTSTYYDKAEDIARAMQGFDIPVFHLDKRIGEHIGVGDMAAATEKFTANCRLAAAIGAKLLVMHLWSGQVSDQHIERNIAAYASLREMAEKHGLLLTVENVICNQRDPMTHMKTLVETYPDIALTFDTKMAAFHSQLDALYAPENAWLLPHIAHMHVNDYAGGHMDWAHMSALPLGKGHIDLERFFAFVRQIGYKGDFTYEATALSEDGTVRFDELNASLTRIAREVRA